MSQTAVQLCCNTVFTTSSTVLHEIRLGIWQKIISSLCSLSPSFFFFSAFLPLHPLLLLLCPPVLLLFFLSFSFHLLFIFFYTTCFSSFSFFSSVNNATESAVVQALEFEAGQRSWLLQQDALHAAAATKLRQEVQASQAAVEAQRANQLADWAAEEQEHALRQHQV